MRVPKVEFIGEQDGPPEQLLKDRLSELFEKETVVQKAYLPKVKIGDKTGVALCLRTHQGPDRALATNVGTVFKGIFNAHEHLDIIFINPNQEIEVAKVCKPFF